jgi:hypothetical protein
MKCVRFYNAYTPILISLLRTVIVMLVIDKAEVYPLISGKLGNITPPPIFNLFLIPFLILIFPALIIFMYIGMSSAVVFAPYATFPGYIILRNHFSNVGRGLHFYSLIISGIFLCISTSFFYFSGEETPHPIASFYQAAIIFQFAVIVVELTNGLAFIANKK